MLKLIFLLAFFALLLSGCAAGPNTTAHTPDTNGHIAGFWLGLWHGIIAPVTFIISLFNDNVSIYDVHNNGGWYNWGFVMGAGILSGGLFRGSRKRCD
jgi:hypothetical protein